MSSISNAGILNKIKKDGKLICQKCGINRGIEIHHVQTMLIRNTHNNKSKKIIKLCRVCHYKIHGKVMKSNRKLKIEDLAKSLTKKRELYVA